MLLFCYINLVKLKKTDSPRLLVTYNLERREYWRGFGAHGSQENLLWGGQRREELSAPI